MRMNSIIFFLFLLLIFNCTFTPILNNNPDVDEDIVDNIVQAPVFNPTGGYITTERDIEITCSTEGAEIYYTIDSSDLSNDGVLYIDPIQISEDVTIRAIAKKSGLENSTISETEFKITDKAWTMLIHFAIDNNIDYVFEEELSIVSNYLSTLESVKANDNEDKINILVMMDGYYVESSFVDGFYSLTGGSFSDDLSVDTGEINSGDVESSKAFIQWAVDNYPAGQYFYSVFNHGSGFDDANIDGTYDGFNLSRGIGFDDSAADCLSHHELKQATEFLKSKIGHNVDLFYAYACLMGGIELAYELKDNVDYLLSSEELFPADEWSYEALDSINNDYTISSEELGSAFCDSAYDYFTIEDRFFTLSLIDLDKIDDLYSSLNIYAETAISNINSNNDLIEDFNYAAYTAFSMYSMYTSSFYYMDLGDYLDNIIENTSDSFNSSLISKAQDVKTKMSDAVFYSKDYGYPNASGITIFHNIALGSLYYPPELYRYLLDFGNNKWVDYVDLIEIVLEEDEYEPDNSSSIANQIVVDGEVQVHSIHAVTDEDWVYFNATSGAIYEIGCDGPNDILIFSVYDEIDLENPIDYGFIEFPAYVMCESDTTYYIQVVSYFGGIGQYSVYVKEREFDTDIYEPDNDITTTNSMNIDDEQDHTFHFPGDVDYIILDASKDITYRIETSFNSMDIDTELTLFDSDENDIAYNDDSGSLFSKIIWICNESGRYYIMVNEFNDNPSDYTINITESEPLVGDKYEPDNDFTTDNFMDIGDSQNHTFHYQGDVDYIKLNAVVGTTYTIETHELTSDTDTILTLFDSSNDEIDFDDDGGNGLYSKIIWECNITGEYYIMVEEFSWYIGDYTITINEGSFGYEPFGSPKDRKRVYKLKRRKDSL